MSGPVRSVFAMEIDMPFEERDDYYRNTAWQFAKDARRIRRGGELADELARVLKPSGVRYATVSLLTGAEKFVEGVFGHLHHEWARVYMEKGYAQHDPVFNNMLLFKREGMWTDILAGKPMSDEGAAVMAEAKKFGVCEGWSKMFRVEPGEWLLVTLQGAEVDHSEDAQLFYHSVGQTYATRGIELVDLKSDYGEPMSNPLTTTQTKVIRLIAMDFRINDIASIMDVRPNTVEQHQKAIRDRLGVTTNNGAVAIAQQRGII